MGTKNNKQTRGFCRSRRVTTTVITALAVAWAVLIFVLSAIPGASYPSHPGFLNYFAHFGEYAVFAVLLTLAIGSRASDSPGHAERPAEEHTEGRTQNGAPSAIALKTVLLAIAIASCYAASDELHQLFVPGRMCDPADWLTDTCGAAVGALIAWTAQQRRGKRG